MNKDRFNKALSIWNEGPKLNEEDYHASTGFLSNSFIGSFQECEYSAIIAGAEKEESEFSETYATGHMVEAEIFEGEEGYKRMMERFGDNAISKKTGKPYAWTKNSRAYAESVLRHEHLKNLLRDPDSIYHKVLTFDLHGFKWRMEIDYLNLKKNTEIDLKTTSSDYVKKEWNDYTKCKDQTFIDKWNYHRQRALYREGIRQNYGQIVKSRILSVSKDTKSVRLFLFDDEDRLKLELTGLKMIVDRFADVLKGDQPQQCGICPHCVQDEVIDYEILTSEFCARV